MQETHILANDDDNSHWWRHRGWYWVGISPSKTAGGVAIVSKQPIEVIATDNIEFKWLHGTSMNKKWCTIYSPTDDDNDRIRWMKWWLSQQDWSLTWVGGDWNGRLWWSDDEFAKNPGRVGKQLWHTMDKSQHVDAFDQCDEGVKWTYLYNTSGKRQRLDYWWTPTSKCVEAIKSLVRILELSDHFPLELLIISPSDAAQRDIWRLDKAILTIQWYFKLDDWIKTQQVTTVQQWMALKEEIRKRAKMEMNARTKVITHKEKSLYRELSKAVQDGDLMMWHSAKEEVLRW